jgi:hypothetical protein
MLSKNTRNAKNYDYLFVKESEPLKEEDIPNIVRLYWCAWIGDADGGAFGIRFNSFYDFEENYYAPMVATYYQDINGLFVFNGNIALPDDAFEYICGLFKEYEIAKMKHKKLPESYAWDFCIELKDGRVIRYGGKGDPPKQFRGLSRALYLYELKLLK